MAIKVLYIDGVGPFGGASRSLFEVVRVLSQGPVDPYFVMQAGTAQDFYGQVARDVIATTGLTRIDNSRYSYYRGLRWLVPLRETYYLPYAIAALRQARERWNDIDLIHVNEIMELFVGVYAKRLFKVPMVVHVRSLQRKDERRERRTRYINNTLRRHANAVIAINQNTRATLPADIDVDVIQNSFTAKKATNSDPALLVRLRALRPTSLKVGFVGNLHHSKGLFDLLDAARIIRASGRDVEFVIVGGVTTPDTGLKGWLLAKSGLAQNVQVELADRVAEYGLQDSFHLLGHTNDIQCVYERLDVITFPSHYDAPGRPVFEAAFSGVPSIVSVTTPQPDTLRPGETGLAIGAHAPKELAEAILYFADRPEEVKRMGANARALAEENFLPSSNAAKLLDVYNRVLGRTARDRANA